MRCLWLVFTFAVLLSVVAAKKKKFDGDFEFVDEVSFIHAEINLYLPGEEKNVCFQIWAH